MKIFFRLIGKIFNRSTKLYYKGFRNSDLIIYDDFFPNPISGFRLDEFTYLLNKIASSKILIDSERTHSIFGYSNKSRLHDFDNFLLQNTKEISKRRVRLVTKFNNINCRVFYIVFYNNLSRIYKYLEFYQIPFIITLYPGGGFIINDDDADKSLAEKLSSKLCKGVIVNQIFTKKYLISKRICQENKIKLIYGLPISSNKLMYDLKLKKYYPIEKKQLDICFVAAKYSTKGMDKGYDVFIDVANSLKKKYEFVSFHVIGGFNETDISILELGNSIKFYGQIKSNELRSTLSNLDIIIAPNRANIISNGAFDGFPVGCCVEASLVGCLVITTDPMEENQFYDENTEIFIVEPDAKQIVYIIENLIADPEKIKKIGAAGMHKTQQLYSEAVQLNERAVYLKDIISQTL